ncbi:MAG: hypothetical protein N3F05_02550 [Candidatus Diapherotrites archaeon]|nr:hypothetical protein [Candidatus Diapherotrites archaeon]
METQPKSISLEEVALLVKAASNKGLALSGGLAIGLYLPEQFRKRRENDLDFTMFYSGKPDEALKVLNEIARTIGLPKFRELKGHSDTQPRRCVFECKIGGKEAIYIHVEATDVKVPVLRVPVETKSAGKFIVILPDINFLVAKLIFGAASPTRPWHRRIDDIAYLSHLLHFQERHVSKDKVLLFLRKLCGGGKKAAKTRANLRHVLTLMRPDEIVKRTANVRTAATFDFGKVMQRISAAYGSSGTPDQEIEISRKIHHATEQTKKEIAKRLGLKCSEGIIWSGLLSKIKGMSAEEKSFFAGRTQRQLGKRIRRLH